ncbi:alpha/beta-hydrolases superfamily protein [Anaeramoeba flamelloides]|uniref:Alpha/beta-hydrolases superfamily protein n=1 Tax=Anaeramoeba flamelloides TaxID=1746091 RepID=A0ABQ8XKA2_9EUKA|nr:alpha/beta-hydrolases superfamily protein [Anaeramoeba flamelloides]
MINNMSVCNSCSQPAAIYCEHCKFSFCQKHTIYHNELHKDHPVIQVSNISFAKKKKNPRIKKLLKKEMVHSKKEIYFSLLCSQAVYLPRDEITEFFQSCQEKHSFIQVEKTCKGFVEFLLASTESELFISFHIQNPMAVLSDFHSASDNQFINSNEHKQLFSSEIHKSSGFLSSIHPGLYSIVSSFPIADFLELSEKKKIIFCGHSLNGSLAHLSAISAILLIQNLLEDYESKSVLSIGFGSPFFCTRSVWDYLEENSIPNQILTIVNDRDCYMNLMNYCMDYFYISMANNLPEEDEIILENLSNNLQSYLQSTGNFNLNNVDLRKKVDKPIKHLDKIFKKLEKKEIDSFGRFLFFDFSSKTFSSDIIHDFDPKKIKKRMNVFEINGPNIKQHSIMNYGKAVVQMFKLRKIFKRYKWGTKKKKKNENFQPILDFKDNKIIRPNINYVTLCRGLRHVKKSAKKYSYKNLQIILTGEHLSFIRALRSEKWSPKDKNSPIKIHGYRFIKETKVRRSDTDHQNSICFEFEPIEILHKNQQMNQDNNNDEDNNDFDDDDENNFENEKYEINKNPKNNINSKYERKDKKVKRKRKGNGKNNRNRKNINEKDIWRGRKREKERKKEKGRKKLKERGKGNKKGKKNTNENENQGKIMNTKKDQEKLKKNLHFSELVDQGFITISIRTYFDEELLIPQKKIKTDKTSNLAGDILRNSTITLDLFYDSFKSALFEMLSDDKGEGGEKNIDSSTTETYTTTENEFINKKIKNNKLSFSYENEEFDSKTDESKNKKNKSKKEKGMGRKTKREGKGKGKGNNGKGKTGGESGESGDELEKEREKGKENGNQMTGKVKGKNGKRNTGGESGESGESGDELEKEGETGKEQKSNDGQKKEKKYKTVIFRTLYDLEKIIFPKEHSILKRHVKKYQDSTIDIIPKCFKKVKKRLKRIYEFLDGDIMLQYKLGFMKQVLCNGIAFAGGIIGGIGGILQKPVKTIYEMGKNVYKDVGGGFLGVVSSILVGVFSIPGAFGGGIPSGLVLGSRAVGKNTKMYLKKKVTKSEKANVYKVRLQFILQSLFDIETETPVNFMSVLEMEDQIVENIISKIQNKDQVEDFFKQKPIFEKLAKESQKLLLRFIRCVLRVNQLRRLQINKVYIGVLGMQNAGKSTLIYEGFGFDANRGITDSGRTTTITSYPIGNGIFLLDYPGFYDPDQQARKLAKLLNFIPKIFIFVGRAGVVDKNSIKCVKPLLKRTRSIYVCLNKIDLQPDLIHEKGTKKYILKNERKVLAQRLGTNVHFTTFTNKAQYNYSPDISGPHDVRNWAISQTIKTLRIKDTKEKRLIRNLFNKNILNKNIEFKNTNSINIHQKLQNYGKSISPPKKIGSISNFPIGEINRPLLDSDGNDSIDSENLEVSSSDTSDEKELIIRPQNQQSEDSQNTIYSENISNFNSMNDDDDTDDEVDTSDDEDDDNFDDIVDDVSETRTQSKVGEDEMSDVNLDSDEQKDKNFIY